MQKNWRYAELQQSTETNRDPWIHPISSHVPPAPIVNYRSSAEHNSNFD